ncbi:von Willebrand factor type A domain-containing protein [Mycena maculata]|uniref:von Willebrand factor type A domain-containing protein n=1 Tax=Mycena maculata TaxID=230809 RepID=A0AAD7P242_9AGAR|nr:von Willebrand factor type A domain-containing protein [Mycena maculata]
MSQAISLHGLYYYFEKRVVSLPLIAVHAEGSIKDFVAQVKLTQTYSNDATVPIEAKYSFPIPARATVCSFVMIKQDGTRVVGSVQEKQEAREAYNAAVSHGQQASLMEQQTPDVFQVSVGNIPSNEQVQIELAYATELAEDEENDSIRFHLPVHIGARYGTPPQSAPSPFSSTAFISSSSKTPFLNIAMSVEAIAPISKIGCPSHTVSTELGPDPKLPNFTELPFSNYARVSLSSDSALDKDFVLTIKSVGLDTPRCIAEPHPTRDTVALGLTLVPRFKLPDLSRQEFVFLVDRSGSMRRKRIEAAKKALIVMLRALPHQESLFQIASFGDYITFLWNDGSKPYNQETLEAATRHVDGMDADYGGTDIQYALEQCFRARKRDRPMSLLVLTDGDAWDLDRVLSAVKSAVVGTPANAFLRVSVLGIGNSASTAMCEGIARLGNGTCMMVGEEETSFTGKIARMLRATRTPPISNISVDWGRAAAKEEMVATSDEDEFEIVDETNEKRALNIFDETDDPIEVDSTLAPQPPPVVLPPPPAVQQAPFKLEKLFPTIRLHVYAILQGKAIPETVVIRGSTANGAEIELPIGVTLSRLQTAPGAPPAVHALAAREIIQDLEDGRHALVATLANSDDNDLLARTVKASVVRLGKTYSISSSHTSFVAVAESMHTLPPTSMHYSAPPQAHSPGSRGATSQSASPYGVRSGSSAAPAVHARDYQPSAISTAAGSRGVESAAPFPREGGGTRSLAPEEPKQSQADGQDFAASPPSKWKTSRSAPQPQAVRGAPVEDESSANALEALARLQSFDGCFSLEVLGIIKLATDIQTVRNMFPVGATDRIVATVVALAFLSMKLGAFLDRDSWEGIYDKAQQYVEAALQNMAMTETVDMLETKVAGMLA